MKNASPPLVLCLMGPTASGKTSTAVQLVERLPVEIVSVDSAMVYRYMNIGTAKPDPGTLAAAPHRLIDIRDPEQPYSAGEFVRDAAREIDEILAAGRIPLLVGGTMLYFRALIDGIAELPEADSTVRAALDRDADERGWPALHAELADIDPAAAGRIAPNDRQRIQRALEVFRVSGRTLSDWHAAPPNSNGYEFLQLALIDPDRSLLHARINARFDEMLDDGFVDEVAQLRERPGLDASSAAMRSVGYRQVWAHLDGEYDLAAAVERAKAATRQLAKRQLTWLRGDPRPARFDPLDADSAGAICRLIEAKLNH